MFKSYLIVLTGAGFLMTLSSNLYAEVPREQAVFAGGCFWCMESAFKDLKGVKEVLSGYTGGSGINPTYDTYAEKGHLEAVQITFDPAVISYSDFLEVFWRQIDPSDAGGQFVDRGSQYRTAIFYRDDKQKTLAEASKEKMKQSGRFPDGIMTEIIPFARFYKAESYHQNFCKLQPARYESYRKASGRDPFLEKVWGRAPHPSTSGSAVRKPFKKPPMEELKKKLSPLQCDVTQRGATEKPFDNPFWDNHLEGIYVDVVSGEPLFSSREKFDSKTGWPSFSKPLESENVVEKKDRTLSIERIEVRSKEGDSHLGHLFSDGPAPTGQRYCINSAALRFIPKEDLDKEGYAPYKKLFKS